MDEILAATAAYEQLNYTYNVTLKSYIADNGRYTKYRPEILVRPRIRHWIFVGSVLTIRMVLLSSKTSNFP